MLDTRRNEERVAGHEALTLIRDEDIALTRVDDVDLIALVRRLRIIAERCVEPQGHGAVFERHRIRLALRPLGRSGAGHLAEQLGE